MIVLMLIMGIVNVGFSVDPVTLTVTEPEPEFYVTQSISVNFSASGGTIDQKWYNVKNSTDWVYPSNQTYTNPVTINDITDGNNYTMYLFANNTDSSESYETVLFGVDLDGIKAENGTAVGIQDAIDLATSREAVYVPAGTYNWTESAPWEIVEIDVEKVSGLFGGRTERYENDSVVEWTTIIQIPWDAGDTDTYNRPALFEITGDGNVSETSRISDFSFIGYRSFNTSATLLINGIRVNSTIDFRIDHNNFEHITGDCIRTFGHYCCGVIDHNIFNNTIGNPDPYDERTIGYGIFPSREDPCYTWDTDISSFMGQYTNYSIYIENNLFTLWRHCVASNYGVHFVFRYNTVVNGTGYGEIDAHTAYTGVGTRAWEVYENTFINPVGYGGVLWSHSMKDGEGVSFNNTITGYNQWGFLYDTNLTAYIWDNTNPTVWHSGDVYEGTDYFLYARPNYTPYPYPHPLVSGEEPTYYYLTMTSELGGTTVPTSGVHDYLDGTNVTVTVTASEGYSFANWTLDGEDGGLDNPTYVYMDENHTLTPNFDVQNYTLTVNPSVGGECNLTIGEYSYIEGVTVYIEATADEGYNFANWTLDLGDGGSDNPTSILMTENHTISANFDEIIYYYLTIEEVTGVTTNPVAGEHIYEENTNVSVAYTLDASYQFDGWLVDSEDAGSGATLYVYMDENHTVNAQASVIIYYLTIDSIMGITTDPVAGVYNYTVDSNVSIIYSLDVSYKFDGWLLDSVSNGSDATLYVIMDGNHTVTPEVSLVYYWGWDCGWWVAPSVALPLIIYLKKKGIDNKHLHLAVIVIVEDLLLRILPILLLQKFISLWSIFIISVTVDAIIHSINKWNILPNRTLLAIVYNSVWYVLFIVGSLVTPILGIILGIIFHFLLDEYLLWKESNNVK